MIEVKRIEQPLTLGILDDIGRRYPVVYVMFSRPEIEGTLNEIFSPSETGELVIIADHGSATDVIRKYGAESSVSMLGFAIHAFTGLATTREQYPGVIRDTRDWRRRQRMAEENEFKSGSRQ